MSTLIAARKPFMVTETETDINWVMKTFYPEDLGTELATYEIKQASYDPAVAEPLGVNIAPFLADSFLHTPQQFPADIQAPIQGEQVLLTLDNGTSTADYLGYDGWVDYADDTLGLCCTQSIRNVSLDGFSYITGKIQGTAKILWFTDTGKTLTLDTDAPATTLSSIFPVIPPALGVDGTDFQVTVIGQNASNVEQWRVTYNIVCAYEETYTIGFINQFGVWEFFDVVGRVIPNTDINRESYVQYSTGNKKNYNVNGRRKYLVNTGWVNEAFMNVIENLLLSEDVILYTGDIATSTRLTVDNTSMPIQSGKADKMINYQINITGAGPLIPLV